MRKQLDPRIPILIDNNVKKNHRSFIVLVGDKGRDQVVNLHYLLSQARVSARPSVLWCYKKELGFTSHRKKREAKIKRDVKRGVREANDQNPFEIFVTVTDIRYTYYKESHKILGRTYGMCVLQDFEAITPNLLARTIETVEGGGVVILLLKTMSSLRQLYSMTMDVHSRYRTSSHDSVTARFNERFILSLGSCPDCLFLDDELNVLPISRGKDITAYEPPSAEPKSTHELKELVASLANAKPAGDLVKLAKTTDQAQAILTFIEAIAEKTLSSTVTLTAGRGRGKSAALGLGIAAALAHGYSNIFLTSPSPENLNTVFEFLFKGLDALGYEEHLDYDIAQSTNPDYNKAIVRVNVFNDHRQTVQYIQPEDAHVLGQAELVIIDEAAAIPLPLVRNLFGPYLVFLASTINGYEGTGRSLSLKLIQQLRDSTRPSVDSVTEVPTKDDDKSATKSGKQPTTVAAPRALRTLREVALTTPIRYSEGDEIESWLNILLCLNATHSPSMTHLSAGCPHPSQCELYYVNRDTLFSFHPASEAFLQRMMALYVASHYKNQPNDLQLMSDAPAHHLFVLLPPINESNASVLPEPLAVIQVALEGSISKASILEGLNRGIRAGGDLIPWLVAQQFQESRFAEMSGARVVRVAVSPEMANMGYGSRAVQALNSYYSGELFDFDNAEKAEEHFPNPAIVEKDVDLHDDTPAIRSPNSMPPLLQRLSERKPEALEYLGVSYGMTGQLLRYWKRLGFVPLYIGQRANDLTGEHTSVMIRGLNSSVDSDLEWLAEFAADFRSRFLTLLSFPKFRDFSAVTALSILDAVNTFSGVRNLDKNGGGAKTLTPALLPSILTPFDLKRLEAYGNNILDYHVIMDLLPLLAQLYFQCRLDGVQQDGADPKSKVHLSPVQGAIILGMGLQRKSVEELEAELTLPVSQVLALLVKIIHKITGRLISIQKEAISETMNTISKAASRTLFIQAPQRTIEEELDEAGEEEAHARETRERQREMINALDLKKYAIDDSMDWAAAETRIGSGVGTSAVVSVKQSGVVQKRKASDGEAAAASDNSQAKKKTRRGKAKK
ncbi:putative nucleolus protein [Cylindrobasidium torrendii FP15055 ss-10]|uniref:RNA cytidine acetyltransferase n=1 Tax=Cylindrobasidium torrendii FP15055 ss-10 TaxID=1314674 RepID=A0A0D7BUJ8_9AGAR|nr:putative nucleolus protein [Cylindrobasidium torrendii FP15055 ss-10]